MSEEETNRKRRKDKREDKQACMQGATAYVSSFGVTYIFWCEYWYFHSLWFVCFDRLIERFSILVDECRIRYDELPMPRDQLPIPLAILLLQQQRVEQQSRSRTIDQRSKARLLRRPTRGVEAGEHLISVIIIADGGECGRWQGAAGECSRWCA